MVGSVCERDWVAATGEPAVSLEEPPAELEPSLLSETDEGEGEVAAGEARPRTVSPSHARFEEFFRTRDPRLRAALIIEHNGLAHSIARRFSWPGLTPEDLL